MIRCVPRAVWALLAGYLAATNAAGQAVDLKVKRVVLFSSGVGFFEREATVTGDAAAELKFRAAQINDIIKSLVVQDLDGGKIGTVSYASQDPVSKTLKSFGVDVTKAGSLPQLLEQLRGEPVEIAAPRELKGVIVSVEKQQVLGPDKLAQEVHVLTILTADGLEQLRLSEVQGLKLTNEKISAELRQALAVLATAHDADKKAVVIHFDGQGERRVRASFLLEAPIWKTSYRLVLDQEAAPFLQGWATVDNATEEDWKDVKLSLISGRPISFQMNLYTPIYIPRPVEDLELYASLRPPELEAGYRFGGSGGGKITERAQAATRGRAAGGEEKGISVRAARRPAGEAPLAVMADAAGDALGFDAYYARLGEAGVQSVAAAQEAGELFEYVIQTPVSLARQHSAMLPIVNDSVAGEKISIFNPGTHPKHPLNGLRVENTTDLHLMQGPVTVFDGSVYAGDAKLPDLKPGEKRLVAYALDLGMEVLTDQKPHPTQNVSLRIVRGVLMHGHKYTDERTYAVRNKAEKKKTLLIEQPYSPEWKLIEPKEPAERTQNLLRFQVEVPAGETVTQTVRLERIAEETIALAECGLDDIVHRISGLGTSVMSPAVREALEKVVQLRTELSQVVQRRTQTEQEIKEAVEEQARIRENLKTVLQNTDAYKRQLTKFDELETQIEQLRGRLAELRKEEEARHKALQDFLKTLTIE